MCSIQFLVVYLALVTVVSGQSIVLANNKLSLEIQPRTNESLNLVFGEANKTRLVGKIGLGLDVENATECYGLENCLQFGEHVQLHVLRHLEDGFTILWQTEDVSIEFRDCIDLQSATKRWFGGPQWHRQEWPIEKMRMHEFPYVTSAKNGSAIAEPYWLDSHGNYVFVDRRTPLFVDQNVIDIGHICFTAKQSIPYFGRKRILLQYTISGLPNTREAHLHAVKNFLGKPKGRPNNKFLSKPIYTTWARFKTQINDSIVLDFVDNIKRYRLPIGHFVIDDSWEDCYGSQVFDTERFRSISDTLWTLRYERFTYSFWIHPFINVNCEDLSEIGNRNGLFMKNLWGMTGTTWWNSEEQQSQHLDFSKTEVRDWFVNALKRLQYEHKVHSFKFDAGESSWAPYRAEMMGDVELSPNQMTTNYVRMAAGFGDLVEVHSGYNTQDLPVLVRMIDKDSTWGADNGLPTLITTLLQMNINGYTLVLPDMIGGNGYNGKPSAELYVRWLQATIFMPAIQFGYVPWDFIEEETDIDVVRITRDLMELREYFSNEIALAMINSTDRGHPVNGPLWWVDPTNPEAHKVDNQFMLGDNIMVAPVVAQTKISRDVYFPKGSWVSGQRPTVAYKGPFVMKYPVNITSLPYFVRRGSSAHDVVKRIHHLN
ncbi:PREDICTED: uncharacterized family 31 glucosidase KIAA1161 [Nicrophorus vespilloides]|uniref:Uncharacterized family 31 glucosidase KIAA1161 n=1 Tax=Nicrophorus vespilloides TaxID=110193 RepID=A0ABM1MU13_NICVS|nr:PREDICTED: uncharacterized family 31 glucosidase KIAA1161 [Nicrophorus vespilloides]